MDIRGIRSGSMGEWIVSKKHQPASFFMFFYQQFCYGHEYYDYCMLQCYAIAFPKGPCSYLVYTLGPSNIDPTPAKPEGHQRDLRSSSTGSSKCSLGLRFRR